MNGDVAAWIAEATQEEIERRIMVAEILSEQRRQQLEYIRETLRDYFEKPDPATEAAREWRELAGRMLATIETMEPMAERGVRAKEHARQRGKARKGTGIDRDELRADVSAWWAKHPSVTFRSQACRAVLRMRNPASGYAKYPITLRTAMEYTKGLTKPV